MSAFGGVRGWYLCVCAHRTRVRVCVRFVCLCLRALIPARIEAQISRGLKMHTREKVTGGTRGLTGCVAACISLMPPSDTQNPGTEGRHVENSTFSPKLVMR